MKNNEIIKAYGTDYVRMTLDILKEANLKELILSKLHAPTDRIPIPTKPEKAHICIKPNLATSSKPENGGVTHPELIIGIIEYLRANGFNNITVAEGSWVGDKTSLALRVSGLKDALDRLDVPFIDMQKERPRKLNLAMMGTQKEHQGKSALTTMDMDICESAFNFDYIINVPVLKGHCQTLMTCALKNMKGFLTNNEKRHFHCLGLHEPIALLNSVISADFILCDHICGDLDFEDGGNPTIVNCIMAGIDPVLFDAYVCGLLHIDINDVPYIGLSEKYGVGSLDLSGLNVRTLYDSPTWHERDLRSMGKVASLKDKVDDVDSCSACYGYLIPALDKLKSEGLLSKLHDKICIGQGYKGECGRLGVGNCTSGFDYYVKGCPPTETEIYEGLKNYIGEHESCEH